MIVGLAAYIAMRQVAPDNVNAQVSAGAIGIVFLVFGQIFPALRQFPVRERSKLILSLFLMFVLLVCFLAYLPIKIAAQKLQTNRYYDLQFDEATKELSSGDAAVRTRAVDKLASLGSIKECKPRAITTLVTHQQSERDPVVLEKFAIALGEFGKDSLPELVAMNVSDQARLADDLGTYLGARIRATFPPVDQVRYDKQELDRRSSLKEFELVTLMENNWPPGSRNLSSCSNPSWGAMSIIFRARDREFDQARWNAWQGINPGTLNDDDIVNRVRPLAATNATLIAILHKLNGKLAGLSRTSDVGCSRPARLRSPRYRFPTSNPSAG